MRQLVKMLMLLMLMFMIPLNVWAETYVLSPATTTIQFKVRNMKIMSVSGTFEKFKGTVDLDEADITKSKVAVTIETASIKTGIDRRDNHLRSADFFEVTTFPAMTFVSKAVKKESSGALVLVGDLTIKGITKPVELQVTGPAIQQGTAKRTATATGTVNRQDFGVRYGSVIGDEVTITITTELVK